MDKAAKAVRRSGVRLLHIGGGHPDLNVLISEVKDMRTTAKAFMAAQNSVAQYMLKWAANEDNRAIQDVSSQLAELNIVWTEVQKDLCEHLKEFRQMFETILEGDKHVSQAKNNLSTCEGKATKTRKELKKAVKKATDQEIYMLEQKLRQAERDKDIAQLEVADRVRENEVVKILCFKEGMLKFSKAYIDFGKKCTMLFEAQNDISHQLPDVHERDIEDIKYTGTGATKFFVQKAKENIRRCNEQSEQPSSSQSNTQHIDDPPPPYSPSDYLRHPNPDSSPSFSFPEATVQNIAVSETLETHRSDGDVNDGEYTHRSDGDVNDGEYTHRSDGDVNDGEYTHRSDGDVNDGEDLPGAMGAAKL